MCIKNKDCFQYFYYDSYPSIETKDDFIETRVVVHLNKVREGRVLHYGKVDVTNVIMFINHIIIIEFVSKNNVNVESRVDSKQVVTLILCGI